MLFGSFLTRLECIVLQCYTRLYVEVHQALQGKLYFVKLSIKLVSVQKIGKQEWCQNRWKTISLKKATCSQVKSKVKLEPV